MARVGVAAAEFRLNHNPTIILSLLLLFIYCLNVVVSALPLAQPASGTFDYNVIRQYFFSLCDNCNFLFCWRKLL